MMQLGDLLADHVTNLNSTIARAEERAELQRRQAAAAGEALRQQGVAEARALIARVEARAMESGMDRSSLRVLLTHVQQQARDLVAQARAAGDAAELRARIAAFEELSHAQATVELRLMALQARVWSELEPEFVGMTPAPGAFSPARPRPA